MQTIWVQFPAPSPWLTTTCNLSSRGSNAPIRAPQAPGMSIVHRYIYESKIFIHIISRKSYSNSLHFISTAGSFHCGSIFVWLMIEPGNVGGSLFPSPPSHHFGAGSWKVHGIAWKQNKMVKVSGFDMFLEYQAFCSASEQVACVSCVHVHATLPTSRTKKQFKNAVMVVSPTVPLRHWWFSRISQGSESKHGGRPAQLPQIPLFMRLSSFFSYQFSWWLL